MRHVVGLDIGGANLKVAHSDGGCRSRPFPLWTSPELLASELQSLLADWLPCVAIAVTMTGELADCFATKSEGVNHILSAAERIAGEVPVLVWQSAGEFVSPDVAREFPMLTAAANWHGLATFLGRMVPEGGALLIDIGSTTTDIIPLEHGVPTPTGRTDGERLMSGELVYTGVRRTPLCALADSVPFRGSNIRVAAELFATTRDVYLLLGDEPEAPTDCDTANGRPATRDAAYDRLVRMLCCDRTEVSRDEAQLIAEFFATRQAESVTAAINQLLSRMAVPCQDVLISGSGSFLAERVAGTHPQLATLPIIRMAEVFSAEIAEAACAFAVARLAIERV